MTNAIETSGLVKTFGATRALDGVDLTIRGGSVYGLLGPNGAGKTTTIRVLTTLLKPTTGRASVLGHDVVREAAAVRQKVSLTGQYASVDEDLTGHENLVLVGRLLGLSWSDARQRATELLAAFGLSEAAGRQVRTFSGGMRRRIDIAASLVTRPEILFLDEPTTGPRPAQPQPGVGSRPADRRRRDHGAADHAVPGGGRSPGRAAGGHRPRPGHRRGHQPRAQVVDRQQRPALPAGQAGATRRGPGADLRAAGRRRPARTPTRRRSRSRCADAAAAADVLGALSRANIQFTDFSLGAPSLDDVFFALTGPPGRREGQRKATTARRPRA